MKTERITVLASKEFKAFLKSQAEAEGVSVSDLVRSRCERQLSPDEQLLATLSRQLNEATERAHAALDAGLAAVESTRTTIRKLREDSEVVA